eukprot:CAMPEP_0202874514 /NCGR_PEP_ID=MMETSP1391-20130828/25547_1 /ASSEMBLY_ACC=CAM_ASM_000867 /TAXON_ID=1034604 /ORGANISM="Chlamydomonas leiostraca, Strain SAG 11-49" /LENGTH=76 /DNA_ID=CAMNT_0049555965 /DNA_START=66 /DNA_END=297 /DNA_ORIENTATION=-
MSVVHVCMYAVILSRKSFRAGRQAVQQVPEVLHPVHNDMEAAGPSSQTGLLLRMLNFELLRVGPGRTQPGGPAAGL